MKLIRTKGRGARETAALLASLERRGGAALDTVLPAVRRIVADVRRRGDRALFRYAAQFDGLDRSGESAYYAGRDGSAWDATDPAVAQGTFDCGPTNPQVCRAPTSEVVELLYGSRACHRAGCASAVVRWLLRPQWSPSATVHSADDCHPRTGSGCGAHRRGLTEAGA